MHKKARVAYAGLDISTLFLICNDSGLQPVCVAQIDNFNTFSLNPCNLLFKLLYKLRINNQRRTLESLLLLFWIVLAPLSTGVFRKYSSYLQLVVKKRLKVIDMYEPVGAKSLADLHIDILLVNAWGLLPTEVVTAPKKGSVNVHPSKLPMYRGALPTLWSLKNKDTESAVSYIVLDKGTDTGNIISQYCFTLENDNWLTVEQKIASIVEKTLIRDLKKYLSGTLPTTPQDTNTASDTGKYNIYRKINPATERAVDIYNKINLYPYIDPGVYCYLTIKNKKRIFIKEAQLVIQQTKMSEIGFYTSWLNFYISTCDGTLKARLFRDIGTTDSIILLFL